MSEDVRARRGRGRRGEDRRGRELDPAVEVPDLVARIEESLAVAGDRLEPGLRQRAEDEVGRTGARAALGSAHTVVALAGATGSGKSSLFNAVAGFTISTVGVRRPTTSHPVACVWGTGADPLLDWLQVPSRHRTVHDSELAGGPGSAMTGLVLLDMPDHDSRELAHRADVDRLVDVIDLIVWVVDPQKYADEALHADYLRRLRGHDDVLIVVLNQVDRLGTAEREAVMGDLRRLVREDGLPAATVMATSTVTGEGVAELRTLFADAVASRAMALGRARAALREVASTLRGTVADDEPFVDDVGGDDRLTEALAGAASVPAVVSAVETGYRRDASAYVGWPFTRWVSRLRRDPLRRLGLKDHKLTGELGALARSSVPEPSRAQLARVDLAERQLLDTATQGLPPRWAESVRQAPVRTEDLRDALDQSVVGTDLSFPPAALVGGGRRAPRRPGRRRAPRAPRAARPVRAGVPPGAVPRCADAVRRRDPGAGAHGPARGRAARGRAAGPGRGLRRARPGAGQGPGRAGPARGRRRDGRPGARPRPRRRRARGPPARAGPAHPLRARPAGCVAVASRLRPGALPVRPAGACRVRPAGASTAGRWASPSTAGRHGTRGAVVAQAPSWSPPTTPSALRREGPTCSTRPGWRCAGTWPPSPCSRSPSRARPCAASGWL
ncbi:GTPase [Aquipuribacter hungaricus]|uniref:GTPase n=1 Tax=Aquipuribacter hungaricus TaxID=545624 RepID=UPI003613481D